MLFMHIIYSYYFFEQIGDEKHDLKPLLIKKKNRFFLKNILKLNMQLI